MCRTNSDCLSNFNGDKHLNMKHSLKEIGVEFKKTVKVKSRKYYLKTYNNVFLGREAVDCLVGITGSTSRDDAIEIGRTLAKEYRLFEHATRDHELKDEYLFYCFREDSSIHDDDNSNNDSSPKEKLRNQLDSKQTRATKIEESYLLQDFMVGKGSFSVVRGAISRSTGSDCAVKCIDRRKLSEKHVESLNNEITLLQELKHTNIIQLHDVFTERNTCYLVMERLHGGELYDRILAKGRYNETEARAVFRNILKAVEYCHQNHVAHRDIKPDNLLLDSKDDDSNVKLADFGFARKVLRPGSLTTCCGTIGYMAPEVLKRSPAYDESADVWSVGVILFILLVGDPPFYGDDIREVCQKTCRGEYAFDGPDNVLISKDAQNMVSMLLTVDPSARLSASEALEHRWLQEGQSKPEERRKLVQKQFVEPKQCVSQYKFETIIRRTTLPMKKYWHRLNHRSRASF